MYGGSYVLNRVWHLTKVVFCSEKLPSVSVATDEVDSGYKYTVPQITFPHCIPEQ